MRPSSVRSILRLALNDLRLTARDRWSFFWMLVLPIAMMWLFGQGGGGGTRSVSLTVFDRDGGWVARAFVSELREGHVDLKTPPPGAAGPPEKVVRSVTLPQGFTEGILSGRQQVLRLLKDEKADADYSRAAEVQIVRAIARTLALLVEMNETGALEAPDAESEFQALRARPPVVGLEVTTAGRGRAVPTGTAQSVPGILTMIVLMMTVIYGGVFLTLEKRNGMLRRQMGLPLTELELFAGKLGGRLLVAAAQVAILLVAGRFVFGVDFGRSPVGLLVLLACYAFAVAGIATFAGAVLKTPEQASAIGWLASMVMAAMGGCWWPGEIVPRWLWNAAHVFPTAWAMDSLHALISFGRGAEAVLAPSAVLVAFGLVFAALGARALRAARS